MKHGVHGFNIKEIPKRILMEYKYFKSKNWSLKEVGDFWDSVTDYDDINEDTYSYYKRFTNTWDLAKDFVNKDMHMLDIQTRTGKGTEFWFEKGVIKKSYLVDYSNYLLGIAEERLKGSRYDCEFIKVDDYNLPFEDDSFDFVTTYETVEHVGNVNLFIKELSRVLKVGGIMILTCPSVFWEPFHWVAAVLGIHHSEGPHNFLRRRKLLQLVQVNNLTILCENTTIILPFNKKILITVNEMLEKYLPKSIIRCIGLRRSFVLKK
jgi:ubiquinone/menaquinone biosynthesis C-methylase UbiE